jgi:hypothetical protein
VTIGAAAPAADPAPTESTSKQPSFPPVQTLE